MQELTEFHGFFLNNIALNIPLSILAVILVGYFGSPLIIWSILLLAIGFGFGAPLVALAILAAVLVIFNLPFLRSALVSKVLMNIMQPLMPKISETERTALEAGVVWVEGDLFSGKPDFKKLMNEPYPNLTAEEKAFVEGPVEELCKMVNDWEIWKSRSLPDEAWNFIKKERFLGMIIPKEYGGLGFSALAHSEVISKLATRSIPTCITVMVPNSLGPAELIIHYGTKEQKDYLLPRLARGEETPCFALTEPAAGSDAGAIQAEGILFKQDGKICIRLTWNKRWITLAAISTIVGLAFRLKDPEDLLGKGGGDLGITCALIPAKTPGVILGRRHDPLGTPFYNCPTQGKDVVVSIDAVVGGVDGVGRGWKMLMECLAAGRGISLPGQAAGCAKLGTRVVSAHASIRRQFGLPIGKFEGIEEPMARIAGFNYMLEAMRRFTVGGLDKGLKPPVVTAIMKYYSTEMSRTMINDVLDIMGGAGISLGPRNLVGNLYMATPISITVEGANILTRTLIIFGQGALRAHPYAFKEVDAVIKGDLKTFDWAFWSHMGHIVRNAFRSFVLSLTRGFFAPSPVSGELSHYYKRLTWVSASFAIMADIAMGTLGGALKAKEKITGRFADILGWMYISTAILRRYEADGRKEEDLPFVHYCLQHGLREIQIAFDGIFDNMRAPGLTWFFKLLGAWSRMNSLGTGVHDRLIGRVSRLIQTEGAQRDRMTEGMFIPKDPKEALGRLEHAFTVIKRAQAAEQKIKQAIKAKQLPRKKTPLLIDEAKEKNIITAEEYGLIKESDVVRFDAIQVDDFSEEEYHSTTITTSGNSGLMFTR